MFEIWICGQWDGADWDLGSHAETWESARRIANDWRDKGFKAAIRDLSRGTTTIVSHD